MKKVSNDNGRPTHKQAVILKAKQEHPELTTREIAKIADTDHAHVIRTLRKYGIDRNSLQVFKNHRADIFAGVQADGIETYFKLNEKDKKKLIMRRGLVDMGIAFDKERLERGQTTDIVALAIADVAAVKAMKAEEVQEAEYEEQ